MIYLHYRPNRWWDEDESYLAAETLEELELIAEKLGSLTVEPPNHACPFPLVSLTPATHAIVMALCDDIHITCNQQWALDRQDYEYRRARK